MTDYVLSIVDVLTHLNSLFLQALVSQVVKATKASNQLPGEGDDFEYYSSFPGFKSFCDKMSGRINRMCVTWR